MKFSDLILYKNNDFFVINKPAGLTVHGDGKNKEKTLVDLILAEYPKMKEVGEPLIIQNLKIKDKNEEKENNDQLSIMNYELRNELEITNKEEKDNLQIIYRPGIVHRLDKETSGVLLIARNQKAFEFFKEQFQNRTIKKNYKAFVWGWVKEDKGEINKPIGRSKKDFRMWSAQRGARGELREAVTNYRVLKRFVVENKREQNLEDKFTFVDVFPQTGRTHQIRVHFKYLSHPLVGDSLYAGKKEPVLGFSRLALHAFSLEFTDLFGKTIKVEAPLPEDFSRVIKKFGLV